MATKTPINQEVVLDLKAKTGNIESSIKSIIQKLQDTGLSDSFTKGYVSALQRILDKSQDLKKVISETNEVNSRTTTQWANSYNKLSSELTRTISRLENSSIDFSDLVGYDQNIYNKLIKNLETVKKAQTEIYSSSNVNSQSKLSLDPMIKGSQKLQENVLKNINNEQQVGELIDVQIGKVKQELILAEAKKKAAQEQLAIYQAISKIDLSKIDGRTTSGKATLASAKALVGGTTKSEISANWKAQQKTLGSRLTKEVSKTEAEANQTVTRTAKQVQDLEKYKVEAIALAQSLYQQFLLAAKAVGLATDELDEFKTTIVKAANLDLTNISKELGQTVNAIQQASHAAEECTDDLIELERRQEFFNNLQGRVTQLFGLANAFQLVRRFVQEAWEAIKELDAAFTKIAVVTDKTTTELWDSFDMYNTMAQQLGVTTTDAIETSALYYQQGLETADVMVLTTETIKMAQIANMGFSEATKAMTAAIRGFKLEMTDANLVTDVYSVLAAEAAVDTQELATAISKTASIAGNAGLSLQDTSAFLTQIIETTQEAAETAGTALKTIIARFTELKKSPTTLIVDVEGEEVSANKIEEALATAQVKLRDAAGEFRDLDTVFLELAKKWDTLSRNTQRYIATTAAGSRQQSRFIAMMDDYKRTMELIGIANDSADASQIQFAKTLDSVSSKVNKLKSNFEALMGNLIENRTVKNFLDLLNKVLVGLVEISERGLGSFSILLVTIGFTVKKLLTTIISAFSKVGKAWEIQRAEIKKDIFVKLHLDTTDIDAKLAKLKQETSNLGGGTTTPSGIIIPKGVKSGASKALNNKDIFNNLKTPLANTVASGFISGMLTGITSGNWSAALGIGLTSTILGVINDPAILKGIGSFTIKAFGGKTISALASGAISAVGGAITSAILPLTAVAVAGAVAYGLYKTFDPLEKAKRKANELKKELEGAKEAAEKTKIQFLTDKDSLKSLSESIKKYQDLSDKVDITKEEQSDLNDLSNKLAQQFPDLISYYDEAGNAVLKQGILWQDILDKQKEIALLSQKQYGNDLVNIAVISEKKRVADIAQTKEEIKKIEQLMINSAATNPGFDAVSIYQDSIDDLQSRLQELEKQSTLTDNAITNAYKANAQSMMEIYNLTSNTKIDKNLYASLQTVIGEELQKAMNPETDFDSEGKLTKEAIVKGQEIADNFLETIQKRLAKGDIDTEELSTRMATSTQEQFIQYLANKGITAEGENSQLYATLLVQFKTETEGREDILNKILENTSDKMFGENPEVIKNAQSKIEEAYLQIFGSKGLQSTASLYGTETGATFLEAIYSKVETGDISEEVAKTLSTIDMRSVTGAQEALSVLINDAGIEAELATKYILDFANALGVSKTVNEKSISSFAGLKNALNKTRYIEKYSKTVRNLNGNFVDLDNDGIQAIIKDIPGTSQIFQDLRDGLIEGAEASKQLREALVAKDLYDVQGQILDVKTAIEDYGIKSYEAADALNTLGLSQEQWLNPDYQAAITAILNGESESFWNLTDSIWDTISATDAMNTVDLSQIANEIAAKTGLNVSDFQALTLSMMDYAQVLENLGVGTIESAWIDDLSRPLNAMDPTAGFEQIEIKYFKYNIKKGTDFTSRYTPRTPKDSGKENDYTTKTDKYYNEIQAINNLQLALEGLAEARDRGDLTPEEYRNNINQTAKYYKELQDRLHWYNEALRADQEKQATSINNAGYGDALKVVNGQLIANKDLIETLSSDTQEAIDEEIEAYEKLSKTIKENSDAWWVAQEKKLKLLEKFQNAYVSLEQRVISILIKQDQEEIEQTEKKYVALKKADDDYLNALKDNINKRRKARAKEESYSDLSKKEKRLALLRRDTSGIYSSEILSLEEEIASARRDISDTEVDDMVTTLKEKATKRAEANDKELTEMQELQKDKEKSMLEYNKEVDKIMQSGAENVLKWLQTYDREYITASETARQKYLEGWKNTINEANSYVDNVANGTVMTSKEAAATKAQGIYNELKGTTNTATSNKTDSTYATAVATLQSKDAIQALDWFLLYIKDRDGITPEDKQKFWSIIKLKHKYEGLSIPKVEGYYSKGGMVDYTGLAMVHGSTSNPESFLSAADTKNFLTLAQLLDSVISYKGLTPTEVADTNATTVMGDININIEVAELANDYDVEQLADVIKQKIVDSSNYRNVNLISKVR